MKLPGRSNREPESTDPGADEPDIDVGDGSSRRPARTSRQKLYLRLFATLCAVVILAFLWILITGLMARSRLQAADDQLPALRRAISAGNLTQARTLAVRIADDAASARRLTAGPAWWTVSNLPVLGTPLRTARVVTRETQRVSAEAPPVLNAADRLVRAHSAKQGIDSQVLKQVTATLGAAATRTSEATEGLAGSSPSWFPAVRRARTRLLTSLRSVDSELAGINRTVSFLGPMLGPDRPQTYFIGFMNEAESRGLGGLPGAFAILTVDRGRFHFSHFGNDVELKHIRTGLNLGAEYNARYGQDDPANFYMNSDVSPDFRDAAQIWAQMWQRKSGQRVDGAVFIDPTALGYLLKVTGPARLADGTYVTSSNVVALTEKDQYSKYSSDPERNAYLNKISSAVSTKIVASADQPLRLAKELRKAVDERRIGLWSADSRLENRIIEAGSGAVLEPATAFTGFTVVNAAGSKLDYYLDRRMTYDRTSCAAGATARASLQLTNNAPRFGLPGYVTFRADQHPKNVRPGDNRLLVTYYASAGATVTSVTVDGRAIPVVTGTENGLTVVSIDLELPVTAGRTMTVIVREPKSASPLTVLRQPLVRPEVTDIGRDCHAGR